MGYLIQVICLILASFAYGETVSEFNGTWLLDGPGTESEINLTDEGQRLRESYDLLVDDPSLKCVPASSSRVWANPNAPIKIEVSSEAIRISYELFDLRRVIPFGSKVDLNDKPSTSNLKGVYFSQMGSSFARYVDSQILIESREHSSGYIRTSRGIPQTSSTTAYELLAVDNGVLHITHTYVDKEIFKDPLVLTYSLRRADELSINPYDCVDSDYGWFEELNSK
ncbi:hypothetical protein N9D99_07215 [Gammaproteobacteria bacterium]|nr:hypothetical protein [Gammaproteobacteria bacterium]MDB2444697.1 hypothetical protein [Gammaproteobacteria bacterium]